MSWNCSAQAASHLDPLGVGRGVQRRHDLAVDVELVLLGGGVADAHRGRVLVAGQPVRLPLVEASLARRPVHDLQLRDVARHGAQQPIPPGHRLGVVPAPHERLEGQGGVAQPTEAIVPVPVPAERLGQRRRRRGDDAAGGLVGERLERDERAHHRVAVGTFVTAVLGPLGPEGLGEVDGVVAVQRWRRVLVGGVPDQREGKTLALGDGEVGDRPQVLPLRLDAVPQGDGVGPGREPGQPLVAGDPGHDLAVVEAHRQLHVHVDRAADALDGADQVGVVVPDGHAVGDAHRPARRVELGLEHERIRPVPATRGEDGTLAAGRRELPVAVGLVTEEPSEAGGGVEVRQAHPVDRSVDADEGGGVQVADDGVILDALAHGPHSCRSNPLGRRFSPICTDRC